MSAGTPSAATPSFCWLEGSDDAARILRTLRGHDHRPLDDGGTGWQDVLLQQLRNVYDRADNPGRHGDVCPLPHSDRGSVDQSRAQRRDVLLYQLRRRDDGRSGPADALTASAPAARLMLCDAVPVTPSCAMPSRQQSRSASGTASRAAGAVSCWVGDPAFVSSAKARGWGRRLTAPPRATSRSGGWVKARSTPRPAARPASCRSLQPAAA
jgi:hypothetical protein